MLDVDFVSNLKSFAESASVGFENFDLIFRLRILVSFLNIDVRDAFSQIVHHFQINSRSEISSEKADDAIQNDCNDIEKWNNVDWETLNHFIESENFSRLQNQIDFWIKFVSFIDFIDEPHVSEELQMHLLALGMKLESSPPADLCPIDALRVALFHVFEGVIYV